ncbi:MAG: beta-ketoacyl-ACP synthase II [Paludibacteraceae bacterium]|jgi:3-oxoacyl-[acyl-carrier-protein] synthase II|nr:beta-ketoacyl-ACP synthase II [Paludibacteraceae bacterium]MDI9536776.1 beta-ketoacyl-ACP synthase II [Bacteroidota bacterium]OQC34753.1 MAG: 3-oxoacyl-(acyl-carrier-protein) synthase 2 [Bacteroidetes bacterium ADurb.Bin057]HHT61816.1 beta-ketoacyl-ACP synthase II [Bacteroidales bacterium]MBP9038776.1 beta-ketoacyl-ACP synthase II [Paludibacteraceae bacterium]
MELRRVVVTGLGAITPLGNSVTETWDNLLKGTSGSKPVTLFDASNCKTQFACEVKNFDPTQYFDRKEIRKVDRFTHLAVGAATESLADSGLNLETENLDKIGVAWGNGIGGIKSFEDELRTYYTQEGENNTPRFNPFFTTRMISNLAPGYISIKFGLRGPNFATVTACASSTNAIIDAFYYIKLNKADVMVAGGSEACVCTTGMAAFNAMFALSTRNDTPETASRPFSKSRDGFVIGEGAACLILEEYEHAKARGAKIYAEIVGAGLNADAYHITAPHPEGIGATTVMKSALEEAEMQPEDVDYINLHGTSTPLGDIAEVKAIKNVFGEHAYKMNLSSTKSMTGHLLGAAGALEAMVSVLAVKNDIIPPTINFTEGDEDPEIDYKLNFTFGKAQQRTVRAALSNNFGFGGHNASVIFKKV